MKKMTVTELNTITDYVVESVLAQKRADVIKEKTDANFKYRRNLLKTK